MIKLTNNITKNYNSEWDSICNKVYSSKVKIKNSEDIIMFIGGITLIVAFGFLLNYFLNVILYVIFGYNIILVTIGLMIAAILVTIFINNRKKQKQLGALKENLRKNILEDGKDVRFLCNIINEMESMGASLLPGKEERESLISLEYIIKKYNELTYLTKGDFTYKFKKKTNAVKFRWYDKEGIEREVTVYVDEHKKTNRDYDELVFTNNKIIFLSAKETEEESQNNCL